MKSVKMFFVSLLVIPCLVQAQYPGGNGRGDISVSLASIPLPVVEVTNLFPVKYALEDNYPNPFNPGTKIRYSIPQTSLVQIRVFNVLGREIEILVNEEKPAGTYEVAWNAIDLPSGVYFYQMRTGKFIQTKKMILLR